MTIDEKDEILDIQPELISIWEMALQLGKVEIKLPTKGQAVSLRQRLYKARRKLIQTAYPNSIQFKRMEASLENEGLMVVVKVPDWVKAVAEGLRMVGVEIPKIEGAPEPPIVSSPEELSHQTETLKGLFSQDEGEE